MYRVLLEEKVHKSIAELPPAIATRIYRALASLQQSPRPFGVLKLTDQEGYRLRIGDYRILYEINDTEKLVTVYRIKHRKEAYR